MSAVTIVSAMTALNRNALPSIGFVRIAAMRAASSAKRGSASIKEIRAARNVSPVGASTLDVEIAILMHAPRA